MHVTCLTHLVLFDIIALSNNILRILQIHSKLNCDRIENSGLKEKETELHNIRVQRRIHFYGKIKVFYTLRKT
jgi:hypothetical protein